MQRKARDVALKAAADEIKSIEESWRWKEECLEQQYKVQLKVQAQRHSRDIHELLQLRKNELNSVKLPAQDVSFACGTHFALARQPEALTTCYSCSDPRAEWVHNPKRPVCA